MRKTAVTVYKFNELAEGVKAKVRDRYRENYPDTEWWWPIYEDVISEAKEYGITLVDDDIQFTGFWSQGDGASFVSKEINNYKFADKVGIKANKEVLDTIELYIDRTIVNYSHENSVHATAVYNDLPSKYEKKAEEYICQYCKKKGTGEYINTHANHQQHGVYFNEDMED